jgi:serine/threonine protein phosphatase PrpC
MRPYQAVSCPAGVRVFLVAWSYKIWRWLARALVASGQLDAAEAATSPDRNQLLRSLGSLRSRRPDYFGELSSPEGRSALLAVGATVLLVSDGVWESSRRRP